MHVVPPICCGMDGHAAPWTACLRRGHDDGQSSTAWRDVGTTYAPLLALRAWLAEHGCPIAVLERTGVSWQPLSHGVVDTWAGVVAPARSVRQRPGQKTETADAAGLAARFAHGLVDPRFLPPPAVHAWRALTRTRVALVHTRPQVHNRLSKVLEDTNSKVAHAMSDLFGTSGRRMLKALWGGSATLTNAPPSPWGPDAASCPSWQWR